MAVETGARFLRRNHLEELLLACCAPHRLEQRRRHVGLLLAAHGRTRISTALPAGNPSLSAGTRIQPSARVRACQGIGLDASGSTPPSTRRTGTTSASPIDEAILRFRVTRLLGSSSLAPARRASSGPPISSRAASAASRRPGSN